MDKKWLWVPFIGLLMLVTLIAILAFQSMGSQLSGGGLGGAMMALVVFPVVIVLSILGIAIFAYVAGRNKTPANPTGTLVKGNHKVGLTIIVLLVLFMFSFCVWYILKG